MVKVKLEYRGYACKETKDRISHRENYDSQRCADHGPRVRVLDALDGLAGNRFVQQVHRMLIKKFY